MLGGHVQALSVRTCVRTGALCFRGAVVFHPQVDCQFEYGAVQLERQAVERHSMADGPLFTACFCADAYTWPNNNNGWPSMKSAWGRRTRAATRKAAAGGRETHRDRFLSVLRCDVDLENLLEIRRPCQVSRELGRRDDVAEPVRLRCLPLGGDVGLARRRRRDRTRRIDEENRRAGANRPAAGRRTSTRRRQRARHQLLAKYKIKLGKCTVSCRRRRGRLRA